MFSHSSVCCHIPEVPERIAYVLLCASVLYHMQGNPKFLEIVTNWQRKLGTVDVVLNTWLDVQKKWQALESIFVGSADIRVQLPEDSKRFDVVNADFQASHLHSLLLLILVLLIHSFLTHMHIMSLRWNHHVRTKHTC